MRINLLYFERQCNHTKIFLIFLEGKEHMETMKPKYENEMVMLLDDMEKRDGPMEDVFLGNRG